jgi:hypothetical protein
MRAQRRDDGGCQSEHRALGRILDVRKHTACWAASMDVAHRLGFRVSGECPSEQAARRRGCGVPEESSRTIKRTRGARTSMRVVFEGQNLELDGRAGCQARRVRRE